MKFYFENLFISTLIIGLAASAAIAKKNNASERSNSSFGIGNQIVYKIIEKAEDGTFEITQGTREVDANSDIVVDFSSSSNLQAEPPSPEWTRLNNILSNVDSMFAERASLREKIGEINLADSKKVLKIQEAIQTFDLKTVQMREKWQSILGLNDSAFTTIVQGSFDGKKKPSQPYNNLARWIRKELDRLNQKDIQLVDSHSFQVTVQAFHSPLGGTRNALHVEGYDNIASGELQPIDRTGLRLTPAEKAHLGMEIEMSQKAAQSIQNIKKSGNDIKDLYIGFFNQIDSAFEALNSALQLFSAQLKANPQAVLDSIFKNANLSEKQHTSAKDITNKLGLFKNDIDQINSIIQQFKNLANGIGTQNLNDILLESNGGLTQYRGVLDSLKSWPVRLEDIQNDVKALGGSITPGQIAGFLPDKTKEIISNINQKSVVIISMIECVSKFISQGQNTDKAVQTLSETDAPSIWRNQYDMVPGRIELARSGIAQGDEVLIKISSRAPATKDSPAKVLNEDTYKMTAVLMTFHREFGASFIFARGFHVQGSANDWKPCVAAHVNWFYHSREGCKVWNGIEPGFGFHLASLNQGVQNVEFGVGINITLFQQILTGGVGYNLFNSNPYGFIGLSLFDLLNEANKVGH